MSEKTFEELVDDHEKAWEKLLEVIKKADEQVDERTSRVEAR